MWMCGDWLFHLLQFWARFYFTFTFDIFFHLEWNSLPYRYPDFPSLRILSPHLKDSTSNCEIPQRHLWNSAQALSKDNQSLYLFCFPWFQRTLSFVLWCSMSWKLLFSIIYYSFISYFRQKSTLQFLLLYLNQNGRSFPGISWTSPSHWLVLPSFLSPLEQVEF